MRTLLTSAHEKNGEIGIHNQDAAPVDESDDLEFWKLWYYKGVSSILINVLSRKYVVNTKYSSNKILCIGKINSTEKQPLIRSL